MTSQTSKSSNFDTQKMLDNAATASQARQLLEPVTRGAILRSIVQWIKFREGYNPNCHDELIEEIQADSEVEE